MSCSSLRLILFPLFLAIGSAAQSNPQPRIVDLAAADGIALKATYFAAAKPGPGVLLLHQCNQQRKSWDVLAEAMTRAGIHVLAVDYRGYGESGGPRFDKLPPEEANRV